MQNLKRKTKQKKKKTNTETHRYREQIGGLRLPEAGHWGDGQNG